VCKGCCGRVVETGEGCNDLRREKRPCSVTLTPVERSARRKHDFCRWAPCPSFGCQVSLCYCYSLSLRGQTMPLRGLAIIPPPSPARRGGLLMSLARWMETCARTPLISRCAPSPLWPLRTACPRSAGCAPPEPPHASYGYAVGSS
jgi:hypothetical protein